MQRDARKWLEDVVVEGGDALEFIESKTLADYQSDKGLRAMVERKLFVVGEAIAQIRTWHPETAERLEDVREIIGFRNILAHGYFALDHARVYDIATGFLPKLVESVSVMLAQIAQE